MCRNSFQATPWWLLSLLTVQNHSKRFLPSRNFSSRSSRFLPSWWPSCEPLNACLLPSVVEKQMIQVVVILKARHLEILVVKKNASMMKLSRAIAPRTLLNGGLPGGSGETLLAPDAVPCKTMLTEVHRARGKTKARRIFCRHQVSTDDATAWFIILISPSPLPANPRKTRSGCFFSRPQPCLNSI